MSTENFTLQGKHIRLEPLEHRHVDGLVSAAGDDAPLYQWSPVPRGKAEATSYIDTALAWRDAGSAVPFAIVRQTTVSCSAPRASGIWNDGRGRRAIPRRARRSRRLRDRLHLAGSLSHPDRRQHRSQAAHAEARLRGVAGASRLLSHRRAQPALARRARTHRRQVRRDSPRPPDGGRLHPSRLGALFDPGGGVAHGEATAASVRGSGLNVARAPSPA